MSNHVWLVTVPNNKEAPGTVFSSISSQAESRQTCKLYKFEMPPLSVGTLDSLMALSDDLSKIGTQVENVVRKVERQYVEISGDGEKEKPKPLRVNDRAIETSFTAFQWDFAQYQSQGKQLGEIVSLIQGVAGKTEDELKLIAASFVEKNLAVQAAQRRKVINLQTSDFEDFLTPEDIAGMDVQNTESLMTVMVVVPKALEDEFANTYSTIGSEIAAFGGPDWTDSSNIGNDDGKYGPNLQRQAIKGSPVVPKSKKKVFESGDFVLYAITILRGHYQAGYYQDDTFINGVFVDYLEPLKAAFRDKRFILRELIYDSSRSGGIDAAIDQAKNDLKQARTTAIRWCKSHFGEVYTAWLHLKVIQGFVESVLRYGLPVDFTPFFVLPDNKNEKDAKTQLMKAIVNVRPNLKQKKHLIDEEEDEDSTDNLPFVCLKFSMIGVGSEST